MPRRIVPAFAILSVLAAVSNLVSLQLPLALFSAQPQRDDIGSTLSFLPKQKHTARYEICFVTAVFGVSLNVVDQPSDWTQFAIENPTFGFFLYTNLQNMVAPGRTTVFKKLDYKRFITHSRWPKFMAWQDERIVQDCPVVFYADAHAVPNVNATIFRQVSRAIVESEHGIAQELHPFAARKFKNAGILGEFFRICKKKRDLPQNIQASLTWLKAQPDFQKNCTMYRNTYFAYKPTSEMWKSCSTTFWNRYSLEVDSWRDQPLWCYAMHHCGAKPLLLDRKNPLFVVNNALRPSGSGIHEYNESSLNDAQEFWSNQSSGKVMDVIRF